VEKYRNPNFPKNYIDHIKNNIGNVDFIFVSSHKKVRYALEDSGIDYIMAYPDKDKMKAEWVGRCYMRGSGNAFCDMLIKNWTEWICEIESESITSIHRKATYILNANQPYLYDVVRSVYKS